MILTILTMIAAVLCYAVSQLQQHGKLRWANDKLPFSFWGKLGYRRKYKKYNSASGERWPTSTNITVFLTDGYHLMQFLHHLLLACSLGLLFEIKIFDFNGNVQAMVLVWLIIKGTHGATYKFLSR